jgi:hypothetical protein
MAESLVDRIADAVLYEGYILYPYRPSTKNRQRWTFGGLVPRQWSERHGAGAGEHWTMQTQCLVWGEPDARISVRVRFLQIIERCIGQLATPLRQWPPTSEPEYNLVPEMTVGDTRHECWQEAMEREIRVSAETLERLRFGSVSEEFQLPACCQLEPLCDDRGQCVGVFVRRQAALDGQIEISVRHLEPGLHRITVQIRNETPFNGDADAPRDEIMLHSLASTHAILHVEKGEFVSQIDPPDGFRKAADECTNTGAWPVLVGEPGDRSTVLAAPIILYDYPQIAPESPGDLFDGTEIDEILTLRILTLTDEEQARVGNLDRRAASMLARSQSLAREQLLGLHGTMRRPL